MKNHCPDRIVHLLQLYLLGDITKEERQELEKWCEEKARNRRFFEQVCQEDLFSKERVVYERHCMLLKNVWEKFLREVLVVGGNMRPCYYFLF